MSIFSWVIIISQSIFQLLYLDPEKRISSLEALQKHSFIADLDFDKILHREIKPPFVPSVSLIWNISILLMLVNGRPLIFLQFLLNEKKL